MTSTGHIDNLKAWIDPQVILAIHGYSDKKQPGPAIRELVSGAANEAMNLAKPRAIYQEFPIAQLKDDCLILENGLLLSIGKVISSLWKGSRSLGVSLYTIGGTLEERVSALLAKGENTEALNLDIAGTVALGAIGYQVQNIACQRAAKQGIEIGPWLNPGYLDWPLTDQRLIFSLIPAQTIEVLLNDHCMMIPKKSVTVCAGIGISSASGDFNRCLHCGVEKCDYRKVTVNQEFDPRRLHDQLNPPGS
jgi:hypothetical protein